jgi:hypothetical protein
LPSDHLVESVHQAVRAVVILDVLHDRSTLPVVTIGADVTKVEDREFPFDCGK